MSIVLGTNRINRRYLGNNLLNKIMLGAIEVFPNLAPSSSFDPSMLFAANDEGGWWDLSPIDASTLVLGAELNPQPDFNAATGWTVGSGMNISGGALNAQNTWASGQSSHTLVLARGKTYYVEAVVENFVGVGTFSINMGNNPSADGSLRISGNGTFKAVLSNNTASAPERLQVGNQSAAGYTMSLTRLSCKEVLSGHNPVLFQDAAGTILVTSVEQPVGLVLDKRKGLALGPELVVNGNFSSSAGWSAAAEVTIVNGTANFNNAPASSDTLFTSIGPATGRAGKRYQVTFEITSYTSGSVGFAVGGNPNIQRAAVGVYTEVFMHNGINTNLVFRCGSAGTTLSIDNVSCKELPGNHRSQPTAAERPLWTARKNLFLRSETYNIAPWVTNAAPTPTAIVPPSGYNQVWNVPNGRVDLRGRMRQSLGVVAGTTYCYTAILKRGSEPRDLMSISVSNFNTFGVTFNLATGLITIPPVGAANASITSLGGGWYKVSLQFTANTTVSSDMDLNFAGMDAGSTLTMSALVAAMQFSTVPALGTVPTPARYQRVNTSTDYDAVGFPHGCKYNGISNSMVTGNINFTAGNKMTACCGWLQPVTPTTQMVMELSSSVSVNAGSFAFYNENTLSINAAISGTPPALMFVRSNTKTFPFLSVNTAIYDIGAPVGANMARLRVNGVVDELSNNLAVRTGNFGNYPLSFGRRIGAGFVFGGTEFSSVVINRHLTSQELSDLETFSKEKTGVVP